jgi:hypothetical protein
MKTRSWKAVCFVSLFFLAALSCGPGNVKDRGENPVAREGQGENVQTPDVKSATPAQWVAGNPTAAAQQAGRPGESGTAAETTTGAAGQENPEDIKPYSEAPLRSQPGEGPAIAIDATTVHAGVVIEGDKATCTYTVHNVGKKDLNILSVQPG